MGLLWDVICLIILGHPHSHLPSLLNSCSVCSKHRNMPSLPSYGTGSYPIIPFSDFIRYGIVFWSLFSHSSNLFLTWYLSQQEHTNYVFIGHCSHTVQTSLLISPCSQYNRNTYVIWSMFSRSSNLTID